MRPFVAALLLLITAWVIVIDPVVCPDGCADAPAGAAVTMHADGDGALPAPEMARAVCLFCLGVTATHAAAPVLAPGLRVEAIGVASIAPAPLPPSHDIDHPPRLV
jgi:hypothetical protein